MSNVRIQVDAGVEWEDEKLRDGISWEVEISENVSINAGMGLAKAARLFPRPAVVLCEALRYLWESGEMTESKPFPDLDKLIIQVQKYLDAWDDKEKKC